MENSYHLLYNYFIDLGLSELWAKYLNMLVLLIVTLIIIYLIDLTIKKLLHNFINKIAEKTKSDIDDILNHNHVFHRIAHIIPFYIALYQVPIIFTDFDTIENLISKVLQVIFVLLILMAVVVFV